MSEDPRIELIRRAFADFRERNVAGLVDFLHPEVVSHVAPSLGLNSGTWQGLDGFVAMNQAWEEPFGVIKYEIRGIDLVNERTALVDVHQEAAGVGSGVPVELDVVMLIEFEGERAIRFRVHANMDEAVAAV